MKNKVYLSFAYTTPKDKSTAIIEVLNGLVDLSYYERGSEYSDKPLKECDIFILILPSNPCVIGTMSMGIKKELTQANILNKEILIADYDGNNVHFYQPIFDLGSVEYNADELLDWSFLEIIREKEEEKSEFTDLDWLNEDKENIGYIL